MVITVLPWLQTTPLICGYPGTGKKFESKDTEVIQNVSTLQLIVLDNLSHDDSYIFLAAVKCLAQMSWYKTDTVSKIKQREV